MATTADRVVLQPGDVAPPFALPDSAGHTVALSDFAGQKVVLYAYPAAATPGCTKQACGFRDALAAFTEGGYAVIGMSPDKPAKLAQFRDGEALTFPLLADPARTTLSAYGAYGKKLLYGKEVTGVIRSTFVIDEGGLITRAMYAVKATGFVDRLRKELDL